MAPNNRADRYRILAIDGGSIRGLMPALVSLGTGSLARRYDYDQVRRWGKVRWSTAVFEMALDGQSDTVPYIIQHLEKKPDYDRFQFYLADISDDIDDASDRNLAAMERTVTAMLGERGAELGALCDRLATPHLQDERAP
jgi:hypothetical protein